MSENQIVKMVDESPKMECAPDDSGYHTNTPLSCEQADSYDRVRTLEMAMSEKSGDHWTPVATGSKTNRGALQSARKRDGILTESRKPSGSNSRLNMAKNPPISSYTVRKRMDSMPNIFLGDTHIIDFSQEARFRSIRLLSEGSVKDTHMYEGWIGLKENETWPAGATHVDFIRQLCVQRSLVGVATRIFHYLQPQDLLSASHVSLLWRRTITQDAVLADTLRVHNIKLENQMMINEASKENGVAYSAAIVTRRASCTDIMNVVMERKTSGAFQPPKAPEVKFEEEAWKRGCWLRPCPRCSHPSQVEDCSMVGQCLRDGCGHRFCVKCLYKAHGGKPCIAEGRDSPVKIIVSSKKSKKNLKRLLGE